MLEWRKEELRFPTRLSTRLRAGRSRFRIPAEAIQFPSNRPNRLWRPTQLLIQWVPGTLLVEAELTAHLSSRLRLKCNGARVETRFRLSAKRMSPFKSAAASVQSTAGSRGVRIGGSNGSNAGYTMLRGSVQSTGYPLHLPVSPSLPLPCVTVCHHISTGLYRCLHQEWQNG
jgi:hypothetical protein